ASAAPPVKFPNMYGIDMPTAEELIAHNRTVDEVCTLIGADGLIFQDLEDLVEACREGNEKLKQFECSIFDGNYIAGKEKPEDQAFKQSNADRKSTRLNSSHVSISYAVFCLK